MNNGKGEKHPAGLINPETQVEAENKKWEYNRTLIEVSLDPLVTIGPDGKIMDVNHATETATGLPREKIIGTDFSQYFDEQGKASAGYKKALHDGKVVDYALHLKHINGSTIPVLYNASTYRDDKDRIIGVFAAARDISTIKKHENELLKFQNTLESMVRQKTEELVIANKELAYQNKEKTKRAKELAVANKELAYQNEEKTKRAEELAVANKELTYQNEEKAKRAEELAYEISERNLAEEKVRESNLRFDIAIEGTNAGIWDWDMKNDQVVFSEQWRAMLGYTEKEVENSFSGWKKLWHPDDVTRIEKAINDYLTGKTKEYEIIHRCRHKDGGWRWIVTRGMIISDSENKPYRWIGTNIDITELRQIEYELLKNEERQTAIFDQSPIAIEFYDKNGDLINANDACLKLFGVMNTDEIWGFRLFDLPQISYDIKQKLANHESVNYEAVYDFEKVKRLKLYQTTRSGTIDIVMSINPLLNGQDIDGYIVQIQNITEEKKTKERILHISYHDQLTGLYNRRFYEEEKERLDVEKHTPLTLLMADLNGLKLTNDAFGHKAGDDLLIRAAKILKAACRTDDTVFRVGGDEFIIFMPKTNAENADKAIDRINKAIEKEASRNNLLSIAMGYSIKHNALDNIDDVYKKAEDEMYRHKLSISESIRSKTIDLIMKTLYEKNSREMEHSKRVSENSVAIAAKMNFNQERINQIKIAGLMHDIGKIGIDEKILEKPGKLEKYEWDEIQRHCEIGYRILSSVNEFSEIAGFILEHHERWDGKGYPMNLKGKDISIQARIICIADAFDAMISERPYRKAFTEQEAIDEIEKNAGTQFDSVIAKVFITKVLGRICA